MATLDLLPDNVSTIAEATKPALDQLLDRYTFEDGALLVQIPQVPSNPGLPGIAVTSRIHLMAFYILGQHFGIWGSSRLSSILISRYSEPPRTKKSIWLWLGVERLIRHLKNSTDL